MKNQVAPIRYRSERHRRYPHLVKVSGGRSSGLMLHRLLEAGALDANRGDVCVFNNTSAEHPATYEFVRSLRLASEDTGIPFYILEFCTYEGRAARGDWWTRIPSYRLVGPEDMATDGSIFEEMISFRNHLPTRMDRVCTSWLKIQPTLAFFEDWLRPAESIPRLGSTANASQITDSDLIARHRSKRGKWPSDALIARKAFVRSRPLVRAAIRYSSVSSIGKPCAGQQRGPRRVSLVGFRADEPKRVANTSMLAEEEVYFPLVEAGIDRAGVRKYWRGRPDDLGVLEEENMSNCVFCFLKGPKRLAQMARRNRAQVSGFHAPAGVEWWASLEEKYHRPDKLGGDQGCGFFGCGSEGSVSYRAIASGDAFEHAPELDLDLPCTCTD